MLKRQRQSSPSPSSPSIPFVADSPGDILERNTKRRRTAAPVLDGTSRGWAPHHSRPNDDEYAYSDDEDQHPAHNTDPYQPQSQSEYTSTNTMLRELHTMHQHRLLFASPSDGQNMNMHAFSDPVQNTPSTLYQPPTLDKTFLPLANERMRAVNILPTAAKTIQSDDIFMEEATRVAELYEGPNKYLGSLFLSRRRKLDAFDEIIGS